MFWRKKELDVVIMQLAEQQKKILDLDLEVQRVKSHIISLRGLINKKFDYSKKDSETEDLKDGVFLPDDKGISG